MGSLASEGALGATAVTVVGLDLGGSKTHAVLGSAAARHGIRSEAPAASAPRILSEAIVQGANVLASGEWKAEAALAEAAERLGRPTVEAVVAGAAGSDAPEVEEVLQRLVSRHFPAKRVVIVHDSRIVLAAAGLDCGYALISGTGSVAWGRRPDGIEARAGGLGYLLGDEGSGYAIVRDSVKAVLLAAQAGHAPSSLARRLTRANGLRVPSELLAAFYADPERGRWAAFAPEVLSAAQEGDRLAGSVVSRAADDLAHLVLSLKAQLGLDAPAVLAGGLLTHAPILADLVIQNLRIAGVAAQALSAAPVHGALALAASLADPDPRPAPQTPRAMGCRL
jgi:N-acetylglucosamine kinase-like BadF-type ATPase